MKIYYAFASIVISSFCSTLGYADTQYTCMGSQTKSAQDENVNVKGTRVKAVVHIENSSSAGDFSYDSQATEVFSSHCPANVGCVAITGMMTDKPSGIINQRVFLIDPGLLAEGKNGYLLLLDSILGNSKFNCEIAQ